MGMENKGQKNVKQFFEPDALVLTDNIERQRDVIEHYQNNLCGGMMLGQELIQELDTVFPGGLLHDSDDFIKSIMQSAIHRMFHILLLRKETAMSGAMRWPWTKKAREEALDSPFK